MIVVAVVAILVLLFMNFNQRMILLSKLRNQEKTLTLEYADLEATKYILETKVAGADSDDAVEQWAREEAGMIQDGDVPLVILPPSEPLAPTPNLVHPLDGPSGILGNLAGTLFRQLTPMTLKPIFSISNASLPAQKEADTVLVSTDLG